MLEKLFGKKESDFAVDLSGNAAASVPLKRSDVTKHVYVLGNMNNNAIPPAEKFELLPPVHKLISSGIHIDLQVHYLDNFKLFPRSTDKQKVAVWSAVLDIFKNADEKEIDDIILVGLSFTGVLEARRIFLERVNEVIGTEPERYERIRKSLEFWAPINQQNTFVRWAKV